MEYSAGGIESLEFILNVKCGENIVRIADRQVRAVGVVRGSARLGRGDDVGVKLDVVLGETVGGGLGGGSFEVIQVAVLFLIIAQALAHMVENLLGELLTLGMGHILADPLGVETGFIHADKANSGEVVIKGAEVVLGVRVKACVKELGDDGAFDLEGAGGEIHHLVETGVEVLLVLREICQTRHVDGHDTDGTGALAGAEVAAGLLAQLTQVETETAAHRAHIARLHVGVDVVGEVGSTILRGHLEEQLVVFGGRPVEVAGDGVGRDRVLEAAAVRVALDHYLDEGLVDHVHLFLAVAVGEVHFLAADYRGLILEVSGDGPVEGDVGERSLSAPAGRGVHAEDEGLDALLDFLLGQVIDADEGGEIGVKRGESLGASPLVLHDAEEVYHLVAEGGEVARGGGVDLAGDAETLLDELLQTPAGAVAGEHAQVVQMNVAVAVCVGDLLIVDLAEPVVGGDGAGVGEDKSADGVGDGGVLLDTPVESAEVLVHGVLVVKVGGLHVAQLLALLAVEYVGLGDCLVAAAGEHCLNAVLYVLNGDEAVLYLGQKVRRDLQRQKINNAVVIFGAGGIERLFDGGGYLIDVEINYLSVTFDYLIHILSSYTLYLKLPAPAPTAHTAPRHRQESAFPSRHTRSGRLSQ